MKKILIIDDEKNILKSVAMYLESYQYEVYSAMDGLEGIKEAKRVQPDLIFLDLILPDIDGFLVCQALKENSSTEAIPLIIMSAKNQQNDFDKAIECGADDYIVKPFEPQDLINMVTKHIK